jgi:hypothetical protein
VAADINAPSVGERLRTWPMQCAGGGPQIANLNRNMVIQKFGKQRKRVSAYAPADAVRAVLRLHVSVFSVTLDKLALG